MIRIPRDARLVLTAIDGAADRATVRGTVHVALPGGYILRRSISVTTTAEDTSASTLDTEVLGAGSIVAGSIELTSGGGITPAEVYAMLELRHMDGAGTVRWQQQIIAGHIGGNVRLSYPYFQTPQAHYRTIRPANPAVGADFSYTLPTSLYCEVLENVGFTLVTDANVATRTPLIYGDDDAVRRWVRFTTTGVAASTTRHIFWGGSPSNGASGNYIIGAAGDTLGSVPPNGRIRSEIANIQAGDQISNLRLCGRFRWTFD